MRCDYQDCNRADVERKGRCWAHQPEFIEECGMGNHCAHFEAGMPCCTCFAKKPTVRFVEVAAGVFMPRYAG